MEPLPKKYQKFLDNPNFIKAIKTLGLEVKDISHNGTCVPDIEKQIFLKTLFQGEDLYLIDEKPDLPKFSYYKRPITNTIPYRSVTLVDVYNVIQGYYFKAATTRWRDNPIRESKGDNFDYVTFSGTFKERNRNKLIEHSGYICFDLDHLKDKGQTRELLINDQHLETELLFTSPSGDGLKWVVRIDINQYDHWTWWTGIAGYLKKVYNLDTDPSGKDHSRACFLPHDENVFVNPKYLKR